MDRNKTERTSGEGRLPAIAPLAVPFVPFQFDNPELYEPRKGLVRGTLFPGLELPFMGMINKNEKPVTPLTELQTLAFAIQEMALYLDTHRDDAEALEMYQAYQRMYHEGMAKYVKEYGPLNHVCPSEGPYRWLNDPWPWEYSRNREV